ncbi:hypothetical protein DPMN_095690 [Dreissena polymorpha]|uniref:Uncharacterized protein n=1 Tax=Dreissena polymorpha TaxID=45954 RepID=A0A9D4R3T7_DREPO|nr:hypothetical protein DPMN_095690 [Dreissena polymorpha]
MSGPLGLVASKEEAKGHSKRSQHAVEYRMRARLTDWKPGGVSSWSPAQHSPHFSRFGIRHTWRESRNRTQGSTQTSLPLDQYPLRKHGHNLRPYPSRRTRSSTNSYPGPMPLA